MQISNLSSLIEILAVANIGYASSKKFRNIISQDIFKLREYIENNRASYKEIIQNLDANLIIEENGYATNDEQSNRINSRLKKPKLFIKKADDNLCYLIDNYEKIIGGLKSIFLLVGIYCIYILIISSTSEFFIKSEINKYISILNILLIPICVIFFRSFSPKYYDINILPKYIVAISITPLVFMMIYSLELFSIQFADKIISIITSNLFTKVLIIIISCSAITLTFLRDILHRSLVRWMPLLINNYTISLTKLYTYKESIENIVNSDNMKKYKLRSITSLLFYSFALFLSYFKEFCYFLVLRCTFSLNKEKTIKI